MKSNIAAIQRLDKRLYSGYIIKVSRESRKALREFPGPARSLKIQKTIEAGQVAFQARCPAPMGRRGRETSPPDTALYGALLFGDSTMSKDTTNSTTFLKDFEGRRLTAVAIFFAALGSAGLNIWGATQIFPNPWTAAAFAMVVTSGEVIAFLALRSIMADRANNHFWKSRLAALILCLAVAGCVISGHRAFHTLSLEAEANHGSLVIRAEAAQKEADKYFTILLLDDEDINRSMWERRQGVADAARLAVKKASPLPAGLVYVFLALFEVVKIGGLWALATPTTMGLTKAQLRAQRRQQKLRDAKSLADFERKLREATGEDDANVVPLRAKS